LNAVYLLQYLQPTKFYTPVSTTVQPTCNYGSTEFSRTVVLSLTYTPILATFLKIQNVDKIKTLKT